MRFVKMHGAGNDYVYVDLFTESLPIEPEKLAPVVADRHFGIGGDGLVLICPSDVADARMRMFNADGSESEMCGNAIRCVAKYVAESRTPRPEQLRIATGKGILTLICYYDGNVVTRVCVDMGNPILTPELVPTSLRMDGLSEDQPIADLLAERLNIDFSRDSKVEPSTLEQLRETRFTCVSMGNPHCVMFVDRITDGLVLGCGPQIERSLENFPNRINVEFIERVSSSELNMRVWERGSGETLACGTGACASVVAAILTGRTDRKVSVNLLGGKLEIEWDEKSGHVFMTGPASYVFSGRVSQEILDGMIRNAR